MAAQLIKPWAKTSNLLPKIGIAHVWIKNALKIHFWKMIIIALAVGMIKKAVHNPYHQRSKFLSMVVLLSKQSYSFKTMGHWHKYRLPRETDRQLIHAKTRGITASLIGPYLLTICPWIIA